MRARRRLRAVRVGAKAWRVDILVELVCEQSGLVVALGNEKGGQGVYLLRYVAVTWDGLNLMRA